MDDLVIGTSQGAFTIDKLKKMKILLPPDINEQLRISEKIKAIDFSILSEQEYLTKL